MDVLFLIQVIMKKCLATSQCLALALAFVLATLDGAGAESEKRIDFNRDIRPILSENCFACHGPDEKTREAEFRLDARQGAFADLGGYHAILPGQPAKSELYRRITATKDGDRMPPAKSGKTLSPEEIALLKKWIEQGAEWQEHWAYVPPVRPGLPKVKEGNWPRNGIDYFVLARLEAEGLRPAAEASKETLIRRVMMDLTGLPPTLPEIDAFLADESATAYESLVDRLLKSPRYGEHMARYWLDAARYGDTHGLHLDNERSIWPFRDWVVRAFNENMRFDEFTVLQIGGDLLPEPNLDQLVATGFNRCNVTTSEGGAIAEEFAVRYAVDRVETLSTVWMGMTAGCAACHDHKFDPISQKEFYSLFAFYNNLDENPMDGNALLPPPVVLLATADEKQRLAGYDRQIELVKKGIRGALTAIDYREPLSAEQVRNLQPREFIWIDDDLPAGAKASTDDKAWKFAPQADAPVLSGLKSTARTAEKLGQQYFTGAKHKLRIGKGDKLFAYVFLDPENPPKEIMFEFHDGKWEHRAFWGEDLIEHGKKDTNERRHIGPLPDAGKWVRLEVGAEQIGFEPGAMIDGWSFSQYGGKAFFDKAGIVSKLPQGSNGFESLLAWERYQREVSKPDLADNVRKAVKEDPAKRSEEQQKEIRDYFLEYAFADTRLVFDPLHAQMDGIKKEREALDKTIPRSLITRELAKPRETHLLKRGEYDKKGDQVHPNVPAILPPFPADQPTNRLGLARWLVDPSHPLTARVAVNRFWQHHFGTGIVKTSEDFGSQGEPPTHPELLDWLATEFIASGWDMKKVHRLIVTSATYRQSSRQASEVAARDPENRLAARGPRFRMDAEMLRDYMLAVSGLLVSEMGGKGVRPYQPDGIWEAVAYPTSSTAKYKRDDGSALYRRSLYTFWKRTAPPPSMLAFDSPSRESCRVRRERTNTPLQALALMNDPQYVEAARHLGKRIMREGGSAAPDRLEYGFRLVTARRPDEKERRILENLYRAHLAEYEQKPEAAETLLGVGESPVASDLEASELAAWTLVANTLLNLDETINKN